MSKLAQFRSSHLGRTLGATGNATLLGLAALYLWCPVHRFPAPHPFQGQHWYNPYATVTSDIRWWKVNLHAHTHAWLGLTAGHGSADDVVARYRAMGYDAAPVSNYQAITHARSDAPSALAAYEQGFNLRKVHFLLLAPRSVDWLDYPLLQGRDEEQHRIDRLRATAGIVIMAHPRLRHALGDSDLQALTGYTAMEIGSKMGRNVDAWDVALDAGRPVWGIADDDTHDAPTPNESGGFWSMIAAPDLDASSLATALTAGQMYAVFGHNGRADIALGSVQLIGDTLSVALRGAPAELQLVGSGGRVLEAEARSDSVRWVLPCDAAWVRVVARTRTTRVFLQPFLRSETGAMPQHAVATVATVPTVMRRGLATILLLLTFAPLVEHLRQRTRTPVGSPIRVPLQDAA